MAKGYMYILECADGSYYVGSTKYLEKRVLQHQNGEGANHTKKHLPVKLVYHEEFSRIDEAFYREKQVQGWSRKKKQALINGAFNKLHDLAACKNDSHHSGFDSAQPPKNDSAQPPEKQRDIERSRNEPRTDSAEGSSGFDSAQGNSGFDSAQPPGKQRDIERSRNEPGNDSAQPPEKQRDIERSRNEPKLRFKEFEGEWEKKKLGDISKVITGSTPPTANREYYDGNKLFVSPADIQGNRYVSKTKTTITELGFSKGRIVKKNSVLFVCIGSTIGKVAQANEDCLTNQQINALESKNDYCNDFVYSILDFKGKKISLLAGVQAVPQINKTDFSNLKYYFPKLKEQQKIANFLTAVDTKLQQLTTKKETLALYKKGVMQQLFPSTSSGQVPQLRFKPDLSEVEGADDGSTFPDWEENMLGEVFKIFNGYAFSSKDSTDKGVLWVKIADVGIQEMKNDSISFLPDSFLVEHKKFILEKGDYILALTRPILNGKLKIARVNEFFNNSLLNQRVGKIVTENNKDFVYFLLQQDFLIKSIENNISGSDPPNLSPSEINNLKVMIPKLKEQQKIANYLSAIDKKIEAVQTQITQTQAFKKGLLQQMFV